MSTDGEFERGCSGFLEGCDCEYCVEHRINVSLEILVSVSVDQIFSGFSDNVLDHCRVEECPGDKGQHEFQEMHFQFGFCQCTRSECCSSDTGHSKDSCSCMFCVCHLTSWTTGSL